MCALVLYAASSPPGVGMWDTAEFQTVAWIAGIPHPTGFPAFVLAGWLFTHLLPFGNPAWRLTMMSGSCTAAACAVLVASLRRFGISRAIAGGTGMLFAVSSIVWIHATRAGVESLTLLFGALATANAVIWARESDRRALVLTGLFAGLALSTHLVAIWYLPGLAILVFKGMKGRAVPRRALAGAACAGLAALALYAYLPLRSAIVTAQALDATRSIGIPPGEAFWDYDHPSTPSGFVTLVTGAVFGAGGSLHAIYDFAQYPAFLRRLGTLIVSEEGAIAAAFACIGLCVLLRERLLLLGLLAIAFCPIPFSMEYGALVDAAKYYLLTLWIAAWFVGLGAHAASSRMKRGKLLFSYALVVAAIAADFFQPASTLRAAVPSLWAQRLDHRGEALVANVLAHTENDAIVSAGWSYVTPLAYAKYVDKTFGARVPLSGTPQAPAIERARTRPLYYMPDFSGPDVPGTISTPVAGSSPVIYRITPR
jgi:hypothetical protein